eukprot:CAMPEP_0178901038 /NCGR_PEP_ID=MMETSP0786-20121207/3794_1 /TAXON_ID=186022 /ORGANISM="Thalassionema frauenfeldii, Strain CCMP 1798" /LENGTH=1053 /DNA_ID=CAMNT_0020572083 /DNA_START=95 /DNA_END=3253 /DNA_ORIENTATION=-
MSTTPTSTLFRSRISSEDIQALLRSASETHINYRNGILLQKALEKERQCQPACEPLRKPNHISPSRPGSTLSLASRNQKPLSPSFAERKTTSMCVEKSPRLSRSIRNKIVESVTVNRLTTIVGPAGSGKSTQVPPLLRSLGAVLCTQPRRLAVVAIAKRVASEIGVSLGGDTVGFHVGNNNLSTHKTQLLFTTAGILLEELRANGSEALTRFRVLIIDECHERSPESDLILSLVKKYLQRNPSSQLRLVLMSATFPHSRYRHYFRHVPGCEVVDTITLERAQSSNQVETFYLDDIIPHLHADHKEFGRRMRLNPDHDLNNVQGGDDKSLSDSMLQLIKSIVIWLDGIEAPNSIFLIFAPTYRHLEQLHGILADINSKKGPPNSLLSISVLHSSVDMEYCLRSIQHSQCTCRGSESLPAVEEAPGRRQILLASAIADSSVTVPGVSCVLDMCRSLQVRWNDFYVAKTVWASKSICDQRQGRTGRTCAGRVFRLLPRGFYLSRLPQWDVPQLTLSSCLNEVLGLVCSKSDLVESDPRATLQECLDPPDPQIVEGAIEFLQGTGAVQSNLNIFDANSNTRRNSKRFNGCMVVPTQYGEILSALPLNVSDAKIVLAGGQLGLLHETIALRAIYNHKPSPIIHNFGDSDKNSATLESFHRFREPNGCYLAHLSAYMFWDYSWNSQRRRKDAIKEFASRSKASSNSGDAREWKSVDAWKWTSEVEEEHVQWCKLHDINPTAVRAIAEVVENTMNALFLSNFEPDWLRCADPTPIWKRPRDWKGHLPDGRSMLYRVYGSNDCNLLSKTLLALLENKVQVAAGYVSQMKMVMDESQLACIHNLTGKCKYGDRCRFSHDLLAPRPPCRFFHGCGVCSKAEKCLYSHEVQQAEQSALALVSEGGDLLTAKLPYLLELHIDPCAWYHYYHQRTMLLGEGNFKFTKALSILGIAPQISSTYMTGQSQDTADRLMGVDATRLHTDNRVIEGIKSGKINAFGWNFPYTGHDEDPIIHEALIVETFQSMALLMDETPDHVGVLLFAVALQANQFSRWNILQCTWRTGW